METKTRVKLYNYPQETNIKTSFDICEYFPIYHNILYPGDTVENLNFDALVRMLTSLHPTMDAANIKLYTVIVPTRQIKPFSVGLPVDFNYTLAMSDLHALFNNYKGDFTKEQYDNLGELNLSHFDPGWGTWNPKPKLLRQFGFPTDNAALQALEKNGQDDYNFNLTYLLAYNKIYFDLFKEKRLEMMTIDDFVKAVNYVMDDKPFTPGQPWTASQGSVPAKRNMGNFLFTWLNCLKYANVDNYVINSLNLNDNEITAYYGGSYNDLFKGLFENYVENVKRYENLNYATRKDLLLKIWNKTNGDKTSCEIIGYNHFYQTISQVVNQTKGNTTSEALGEVGGMSVTFNQGQLVNYYQAQEECVLMVIGVANYETTFQNYVDNYQWFENVSHPAKSYYNPNVEFLQDDLKMLNFPSSKIKTNRTIGFQTPFNFLRKQHNIIGGDIRDKWKGWTYARELLPGDPYNTDGFLNIQTFKSTKTEFKNTLVSPNQDAFLAEFQIKGNFKRSLKPEYEIRDKVLKGE